VLNASGTARKVSQLGDLQLTLPGGLRVDIVAYAADWVSNPLISARQAVSAGWTLQASARQRYLRIENVEVVWLLELDEAFQLHARTVVPKRTTRVTPEARSPPPTPPRQHRARFKPDLLPPPLPPPNKKMWRQYEDSKPCMLPTPPPPIRESGAGPVHDYTPYRARLHTVRDRPGPVPDQTRHKRFNQREAIREWVRQAPPRSALQSREHAPAAAPQQQQQRQQHPRNSNRFAPLAKHE
jgi:hypothetical protein